MSEPEVGAVMKDGTIFAGIAPQTGNWLFVTPKDVGVLETFAEALNYAQTMNRAESFGHGDWRLPTLKELDVIFGNKEKGALKDSFNPAGADYAMLRHQKRAPGWYRTSDWGSNVTGWCQLFKTGDRAVIFNAVSTSVRFVREEPPPAPPPPQPYTTPAFVTARQSRLIQLAQEHKPKIKSP